MTPQEYQAWLKTDGRRAVLAEIDMGGGEIIRLSNVAYTTLPTDATPNRAYLPHIQGGVAFTSRLTIDGSPSVSIGDIEVANEDGHLDGWLSKVWTNRRIQVFFGDVTWPLADFQLVLSGVIDSLGSRSSNRLNIVIKDNLQRLNTPISEVLVGGTGNNKEDLAPLIFGECHNVAPVLYDEAFHEYLVTLNTAELVLEVRDNGVPVGFTMVAANRFRLTASPAGTITASVQAGEGGIVEDWSNTAWATRWTHISGGGEVSVVASAASTIGPNVLRIGNNTGDDQFWANNNKLITVVPGQPIRVEMRYRRTAGTGAAYLGFTGIAADGVTLVSTTGAAENVNQHYTNATLTASIVNGTWYTLVGYASTTGTATRNNTTETNPLKLHENVRYVKPVILTGYQNMTGTWEVDYVSTSPVYTDRISGIVRTLATLYGSRTERLLSTEIDQSDFNSFNIMNPQPVGVYLDGRANVLATCQELASSVGGQVVTASDGRLRIRKLDVPTHRLGVVISPSDYVSKSLSVTSRPIVKAGIRLGYCKNWTVQTLESGIPPEHKDLFAKEWLETQEADSAIATAHRLNVEPPMVETLLLVEADAKAEAVRRLALWSKQRNVFSLTGYPQLITLELGDSVLLYGKRWGLEGGIPGSVLSIKKDWISGRVDIEVLT